MRAIVASAILAAILPAGAAFAQSEQLLAAEGKAILSGKCGRCHQVAPTGNSPLAAAPPFHEVMRRYPPEDLEEALGEGLSSGHPEMPEFVFEPDEISAILAYLETLHAKR